MWKGWELDNRGGVVVNEKAKYYLAATAVVLAIAAGWFLLREPDVHDQRDAADSVRESLERAGSEQRRTDDALRRIGDGIDRSDEAAQRIEESNSRAAESVAGAQERIRRGAAITLDSERRIKESQRILQSVRESTRKD